MSDWLKENIVDVIVWVFIICLLASVSACTAKQIAEVFHAFK